jgi:hypothetical protein
MSSSYVYAPVVKGKINDAKAVARLGDDAKVRIKPMVELMPWVEKKASPTIDHHLTKFLDYVSDYLSGIPLFVDMYGFLPGQKLASGAFGAIGGYEQLIKRGHKFTPVFGINRDDLLWPGFKSVVAKNAQGLCFRVERDDIEDAADDTWHEIVERSAELKLKHKQIDIFIDLKDVREADVSNLKDIVLDFLGANSKFAEYRSVIISGSSALKTVTAVDEDGQMGVVRNELFLWTLLRRDIHESVNLVFSDYGVVHPYFAGGGNAKNMNAKIRYTAGLRIHYFRGHRLNYPTKDYEQYRQLADNVRNASIFKGGTFSFGDGYLEDCANGLTKTPGSPQTWVIAEINHHITATTQQIELLLETVLTATDEEIPALLEAS